MNPTFQDLYTAQMFRLDALARKHQQLSSAETESEKAAAHSEYAYTLDVILTFLLNRVAATPKKNEDLRMAQ